MVFKIFALPSGSVVPEGHSRKGLRHPWAYEGTERRFHTLFERLSNRSVQISKCNIYGILAIYLSIKDLAIEDRYNFHKNYSGEIITKAYFYNNAKVDELFRDFSVGSKSIFNSKREIVEMLLGNYIHEDHLNRRILSKLTKDMAKEVGLELR
jgi:hypothetical protein